MVNCVRIVLANGTFVNHIPIICYNWVTMGRPKKNSESVGVLALRQHPDGRRKIKLRNSERAALERQRLIEGAVALFLDTTVGRSWAEIAEQLHISPMKLRDITKSEEFEKAYDLMFAEIGHDPRYKAAQGAIMDLVTPAIAELRSIIVNRGATPATKVKAIELALKVAKLELKPPEESDRTDIIKWTEEHRTEVQIPKEFLDAAQKYGLDRVVEGQFQAAAETDDSTPLLSSNVETSAASIDAN
jgi:hypothetical protein